MAYDLNTTKSWSETKADLQKMFGVWARAASRRIEWGFDCPTTMYSRAGLARDERRVTVWYTNPSTGEETRITIDKFARPMDNLRAIYLGLDAIRLNEARGIGEVLQQHYLALPAPAHVRDPHEVLGIRPGAPAEVIEASYRALAKTAHPDRGGSDERMAELNAAYEAVKAK